MYFPYFQLGCNLEINSQRTAAYIDAAHQNGKLGQFDLKCDCGPLHFALDADEDWVPATYTNPITDQAPWYDSSISESGGFIGFMIEDVTQDQAVASRNVGTRVSSSGGGSLGPLRNKERRLDFTVLMFAENEASMEYGFRYLTDALTSPGCDDGCTLCDAEFRDSCPQVDGSAASLNKGRWLLKNVGTVAGPVWGDAPLKGSACNMRRVSFSLVSEFPWKFKCPVTVLSGQSLAGYSSEGVNCAGWDTILCGEQEVLCTVSESLIVGESGLIIEITAGTIPLQHIKIAIRPDPYGYEANAVTRPAGYIRTEPCDLIYIPSLPASHTLIYDTSIETMSLLSPGGGVTDATYLIATEEGRAPTFPTLRCGDFCVSLSASECSVVGTPKVTIRSVHREI